MVYGQNRTITEATTIRTIRMDRTDTIISIGALTTFRRTGITDIISTAGGTAGIVAKIGVRMISKIPGCFRLTSQSGPNRRRDGRKPGLKKAAPLNPADGAPT